MKLLLQGYLKTQSHVSSVPKELYKKILGGFRKSHVLPLERFDQDVVITSKSGNKHSFSSEILKLFSTYFTELISPKMRENQAIFIISSDGAQKKLLYIPINENLINRVVADAGIIKIAENQSQKNKYDITLDLSDDAIKILMHYFCSKKAETEDVTVLHELLKFARMIDKKSFLSLLSEKIIAILIDESNRGQFSPELICGQEELFIERYLSHRNISFSETPKKILHVAMSDFINLFSSDDKLTEFLSKKIRSIDFNGENYGMLSYIPKKYRKSITRLTAKSFGEDIETTCRDIHLLFPCCTHMVLDEETRKLIEKYLLEQSGYIPFTNSLYGIVLSAYGKFNQAIKYLSRAIDLNPKNALAQFYLGHCFGTQRKYDQAVEHLSEALELDPEYAFARVYLACCFSEQKKYDQAMLYFKKAIELDPKNAFAHVRLGDCLRAQKEYLQAIEHSNKALELDPKNAFAYDNLGECFREQKKYDQAMLYFKKAIELDPKLVTAHARLGECFREQKNILKL